LRAVSWAESKGARVVLLAASTKRLFGPDGAELRERHPNLIFTIGDNGTLGLLQQETILALKNADLCNSVSRIAVLGPYGLLGEMVLKALLRESLNVVGVRTNKAGLEGVNSKYGVECAHGLSQMGKVDAVVACTHSPRVRLTADLIRNGGVRRANKKLLVLDVAEPSNLTLRQYRRCADVCLRQDAGNAYSPKLKYVLGYISYGLFRLTRGVTFGCFAEALSLASALKEGDETVKTVNWFEINDKNIQLATELLARHGFILPSPRCFGKPIKDYGLSISAGKHELQSFQVSQPPYEPEFQRRRS